MGSNFNICYLEINLLDIEQLKTDITLFKLYKLAVLLICHINTLDFCACDYFLTHQTENITPHTMRAHVKTQRKCNSRKDIAITLVLPNNAKAVAVDSLFIVASIVYIGFVFWFLFHNAVLRVFSF